VGGERHGGKPSVLDGIPDTLPALLRARRVTEQAALVGFDWPSVEPVWEKIAEEVAELQEAVASGQGPARVEAELGDLLLAITNLSRFFGVDPERGLRQATERFVRRFRGIEARLAAAGCRMEEESLDDLEELWQAEKRGERG